MVGEDRCAFAARHGLLKLRVQIVAVKYVVAQYQDTGVVADKFFTNDKGLRQPVWARLHRVVKLNAPLAAVTEQLLEAWRILRCRDNQDVTNPSQHQRAQRVVDHRLVVDGE